MINNRAGTTYDTNSVFKLDVDLDANVFVVVVGSSNESSISNRPEVVTQLRFKCSVWNPDYYNIIDDLINKHPAWATNTIVEPYMLFDIDSEQMIDPRTLDEIKTKQWEIIKAARTQAEYSGFTWDGSAFDSDAVSQARLTGAVQLAQLNPAMTLDWTLKNNTVRTLSAADLTAVGVALGVHVATQFAKGQALRAQIDAATTKEAVEAIVW